MADVEQIAQQARRAGRRLATTTHEQRNAVLKTAATVIRRMSEQIQSANDEDMMVASDLSASAKARLTLSPEKIKAMAAGLESLASLPDPLGRVDLRRELDDGLILTRTTVPLGVLGVVFESRPTRRSRSAAWPSSLATQPCSRAVPKPVTRWRCWWASCATPSRRTAWTSRRSCR